LVIEETIFVFVKKDEHVVTFDFCEIVDHVVFQKGVDIVGAYLAKSCTIDAFEGGPGLKADLFG
jgi:hypothetical protein